MNPMPWWRWIAATFVIAVLWIYPAAMIAALAPQLLPGTAPWQQLLRDLAGFIPLFLATPLVWRYVTGTPIARLVNVTSRINRQRIVTGFVVWFLLSALSSAVDYPFHTSHYRLTFDAGNFLPFAAVVAVLLPVQAWAEELFFRGWILRWAAALPPLAQAVISGVVFALPHAGNPEASMHAAAALASWFLLGAGWAYASVRDGGIELALGAHLANNAFSLLIVGYDGAALPTAAIVTTSALDINATLVSLMILAPAFIFLTRQRH